MNRMLNEDIIKTSEQKPQSDVDLTKETLSFYDRIGIDKNLLFYHGLFSLVIR